MTTEELKAAITVFRKEVEDIVPLIVTRLYFNNGQPYADTAEVLALITDERAAYLTVNVMGVEYWFLPDLVTLVPKVGFLALVDGSVTLIKMANVASGTVFYRKTAGDGPPEVQTLAQLRIDLQIPDVTGKVDAIEGYSLVANTSISNIHAPGSDNQDLSGLVEKMAGYSLIADTELARLATIKQNVYRITLPQAATVAGRCINAVAGTDYPTGWILTEGSNAVDLKITHALGMRVAHVSICSVDAGVERQLMGNAAYSGIYTETDGILVIESLATVQSVITINIVFS